jgi:hypothetical protein
VYAKTDILYIKLKWRFQSLKHCSAQQGFKKVFIISNKDFFCCSLSFVKYCISSLSIAELAIYIEQQTIEAAVASGKQIITIRDFLVVTAALGDLISTKKQPLPVEKTLWQGIQQLHAICKGFRIVKLKYGTS